ncbi:MAG: hypothetical protein JKX79_05375 [Labilibaculum sp.]|nr:hypothetical protein [Labilibaculum sp.]
MKKLLLYIGCAVAMLSACDPNDEFIDTLDTEAKAAGIDIPKNESYTLTADDYDIVEKGNYDNFDSDEEAAELVPTILAERYAANSSDGKFEIRVSYNIYVGSLKYLRDIVDFKEYAAALETYELDSDDFDSMGEEYGEPGDYDNFDYKMDIPSYLTPFLLAKYPDAVADDEVLIIYDYYAGGGVSLVKSDVYGFDGSVWSNTKTAPEAPADVELYELIYSDYNEMGNTSDDDSFTTVDKAEYFLPILLTQKYPYAKSGDKVAFIFMDGGDFAGEEYTFDGTVWAAYQSTIVSSAPFKFDGTVWTVIPPIKFVIVDAVGDAIIFRGAEGNGAMIDEDYALVGNGYYKNFDVRAGKAEETEAVRIEKLSKIIKNKYDDLALDQVYFIQYEVYAGNEGIESQDSDGDGLWDVYLKAVEDN